jgi:transposase
MILYSHIPYKETAMRKLKIGDAELMQIAIRQEIERTDESRYDHRLHGVLLVAGNHTCTEVARLFGEDRRTIQRWVNKFETGGFDGLREGDHPGRPDRLDERQWESVAADLRKNPRDFGHGQNLWDGKILSEHLKQHYHVKLGVRQCQRMFSKLGFRLRKPRPQVAQADPVKVDVFKKTAAFGKKKGH